MTAFHPDIDAPRRMIAACPAYRETPLRTAEVDGVPLLMKDETERMGLGAFKALGGVYAVACLIEEAWRADGGAALAPEDFVSEPVRAFAGNLTFVCASAGNHGMAVAAGARVFGAKARIHLSATVPPAFADRLRAKDAEVVWSGDVYEESIAAAIKDAEESGAIHLADGSWPGYVHAPALVMEGYTVMGEEMRQRFEASGEWPRRVCLQGGVGGLAAGVTVAIRERWSVQPEIVIVEPDAAPCLKASKEAGKPVRADGPVSNMGRLDCKEPSILAVEALNRLADRFVTISDEAGDRAVARAADLGLATTPSGGAGLAAVLENAGDWRGEPTLVIVSEGAV